MANDDITRTSIIYHSIGFVNDKIERNYYFFVDILKEGILLFDSGKFSLSEPKNLDSTQRQEKSTEEFEHWFKSAIHFLEAFEIFLQKGESDLDYYKIAAFQPIKLRKDIMLLFFLFSLTTSRESTTSSY